MLKYRALTTNELSELETEFKQFLILNELYDNEWRALSIKDPQKAQGFIDLFANIVLEKVYNQLQGLVHIGKDFVTIFDVQNEVWQFFHFQLKSKDLISECNPDNVLTFIQNSWPNLTLHKGSKKSSEQKAQDVFALVCKGAMPLHPQVLQQFLKLITTK